MQSPKCNGTVEVSCVVCVCIITQEVHKLMIFRWHAQECRVATAARWMYGVLCVACRVSTHEVRQLDLFQQSEEERKVQSAAQWMRGALCVVYISTNEMQQLVLFKWLHDASETMPCWIILAWS